MPVALTPGIALVTPEALTPEALTETGLLINQTLVVARFVERGLSEAIGGERWKFLLHSAATELYLKSTELSPRSIVTSPSTAGLSSAEIHWYWA